MCGLQTSHRLWQFEAAETGRYGPLQTLQRHVAASDAPGIGCVAQGEGARLLGHKNRVKSSKTVAPKRRTVSGHLTAEKTLIFASFCCFLTTQRLRGHDFPILDERTHRPGRFGCSPSSRAF